MKLKNTLFLLLVVALVVAVAGCSSDNNGAGVQQVKTSTEPQASSQSQATPQEQATPVKGSLKNPAGINDTLTIESTDNTYDFSVVKAIRGDEAMYVVKKGNEYNDKPATGYEYLLVDVKTSYTKGENSAFMYNGNFKVFCDNVECKTSYATLPKDYIMLEGGDVMPGGVKEGWILYTVPQGKEAIIGFQPNSFEGSTGYITLGSK